MYLIYFINVLQEKYKIITDEVQRQHKEMKTNKE